MRTTGFTEEQLQEIHKAFLFKMYKHPDEEERELAKEIKETAEELIAHIANEIANERGY
jgi:hypothetical protein